MASSKSPEQPEIPEADQDRISNLPINVTDKIMKYLPLPMAAKTSVLSRKWRLNWLSIRYLIFDKAFYETHCKKDERLALQRMSNIISNIMLHHNGPLHKFHLYVPKIALGKEFNLSQWLSYLSRVEVKKIIVSNWSEYVNIPSYVYACKELVKLSIDYYILTPPPMDFKGFAYLRILEFLYVKFKHDHVFASLIACCPQLTELTLMTWEGMEILVIDVPSLEKLTIQGQFVSLSLKNVLHLKSISVTFQERQDTANVDAIDIFASSSELQLQYLHFGGQTCQLLTAGSTTALPALASNNLTQLRLTKIDLGNFNVFCSTIRMLQSCPFIKHLKISVTHSNITVEHSSTIKYDDNYIFGYLVKVEIEGIKGTSAELKLIEYILSISVVLEELLLKFKLDAKSEVMMARELLRLPRISTKAKLICLEQ